MAKRIDGSWLQFPAPAYSASRPKLQRSASKRFAAPESATSLAPTGKNGGGSHRVAIGQRPA